MAQTLTSDPLPHHRHRNGVLVGNRSCGHVRHVGVTLLLAIMEVIDSSQQ